MKARRIGEKKEEEKVLQLGGKLLQLWGKSLEFGGKCSDVLKNDVISLFELHGIVNNESNCNI